MTDLTMPQLAMMVWEYVGTDPRTEDEIRAMLERQTYLVGSEKRHLDEDLCRNLPGWCAGRGYIRLAAGNEKTPRWIQGNRPKGVDQ